MTDRRRYPPIASLRLALRVTSAVAAARFLRHAERSELLTTLLSLDGHSIPIATSKYYYLLVLSVCPRDAEAAATKPAGGACGTRISPVALTVMYVAGLAGPSSKSYP